MLRISQGDGVPIYQQIINQIKYLIASGSMEPGQELPAIRVLASQLLINPNTVARAYRDLTTLGLVTKRLGAGTFVSDQSAPLAEIECERILRERVVALLTEAHHLNVSTERVMEMFHGEDAMLKLKESSK